MTVSLQILLIAGAISAFIYTAARIRESDVRIIDMFPWIVLSVILVLMSVFPRLIMKLAHFFGFESSVSFVFLIIISFLLFRCFSLSIQLSREKEKMRSAIIEVSIKLQELEKTQKDENTVS